MLSLWKQHRAFRRLMRIRMRLGMFDPPSTVAPNNASYTPDIQCQSDAHVALAKTAAQESIVLLKNANGVLPLSRGAFQCQCDASSYEDNTDYFQPNNPSSAAKDADDCCAQVRSYYSHLLTPTHTFQCNSLGYYERVHL